MKTYLLRLHAVFKRAAQLKQPVASSFVGLWLDRIDRIVMHMPEMMLEAHMSSELC
jgi:hypothetical protein